MQLSSLTLKDFRSYPEFVLHFNKPINMIVGSNAAGKTNILEAIVLLSLGRSFRAGKDEEMIHFGSEFGRVSGDVSGDSLEIVLTRGLWQGKKVAKKRFLINGVPKRRKDFVGQLKTVLFEPRDLDLIIGSPSHRRDFLDFVLSQVDLEYDRCLLAYDKGLRQRNRLLDFIRDGRAKLPQLEFWNKLLIKNGDIIRSKREDFLTFTNQLFSHGGIRPDGWVELPLYKLTYTPSPISEKRLAEHLEAEIATGSTLVGPHRDDFQLFQVNGFTLSGEGERDLSTYGSRGEQRLAALALKLSQLTFIKEKTQEQPLLLLDDIFSELDKDHDQLVMKILGNQQTVITTTDAVSLPLGIKEQVEVIELS